MAAHTINTTPEQEQTLAWLVATVNAEKGSKLTVDQFLAMQVATVLGPYVLRYHEAESLAVKASFEATSDPTQRAAVKTALNVPI